MKSLTGLVMISLVIFSAAGPSVQEPDVDYARLELEELRKLAGSWEIRVDSKEGWQGMIYMFVKAGPPIFTDPDACGEAIFDAKLRHEKKRTISLINVASATPTFAGIRKGKRTFIITGVQGRREPFRLQVLPEYTTSFELDEAKLTMDFSRSAPFFLPTKLLELDLDFSKIVWTRGTKLAPGGGK